MKKKPYLNFNRQNSLTVISKIVFVTDYIWLFILPVLGKNLIKERHGMLGGYKIKPDVAYVLRSLCVEQRAKSLE